MGKVQLTEKRKRRLVSGSAVLQSAAAKWLLETRLNKEVAAVKNAVARVAKENAWLQSEAGGSMAALHRAEAVLRSARFKLVLTIISAGGAQWAIEHLGGMHLVKITRGGFGLMAVPFRYREKDQEMIAIRAIDELCEGVGLVERIAEKLTALRKDSDMFKRSDDLLALGEHFFRFVNGKYELLV